MNSLNQITRGILETPLENYGLLYENCSKLYDELVTLTHFDDRLNSHRENKQLDAGTSLGASWAAMCIKDIARTKRFMDGVFDAVKAKKAENPGKCIHLLYAGTGPFATLVLPLLNHFTAREIQFSFLEINRESFDTLRSLVDTLGIRQYIHRLENVDATRWTIPATDEIDILVSETMQQALRSEPLVAIYRNLLPQLSEDAIIIPEEVRLVAAYIDPVARMKQRMGLEVTDNVFPIEQVFVLNSSEARRPSQEDRMIQLSAQSGQREIHILTEVTIYGQHCLSIDQSALTLPYRVNLSNSQDKQKISFRYQTGESPGLQFSVI